MRTNKLEFLNDSSVLDGPITLRESEPASEGGVIIGLELDILDERLDFRIAATDSQVGLEAIVPVARAISARITHTVVQHIRGKNGIVPCRRNCEVCCHYLVPLSVPEALKFREEFVSRPKRQQREMLGLYLSVAKKILSRELPRSFRDRSMLESADDLAGLNELSHWFENLKVACPFLSQGICLIYQQRPLACREYFVTGFGKDCDNDCCGNERLAEVVEVPIRMVEVLGQLSGLLEATILEAVTLPLLPAWWEQNAERGQQLWPASAMVEHFVLIIEEMATANSAPAISPA